MIDRLNKHLSLTRQCQLLGLSRSSLYYQPATDNTEDLSLMALIDRQFLETPYYGSRKMTAWLRREGHIVNRKRVRRLMRQMGLQVIWQKPNTSQAEPRAQGLSVLAARPHHRSAQPGVGDRYHVHPDAKGIFLPGGDHGLAQQESAELAAV